MLFKKTDIKDSWAIQNLIYYSKADYNKVKEVTLEGVSKHSANINPKDYQKSSQQLYRNISFFRCSN